MLIRIQSTSGMKRLDIPDKATLQDLKLKVSQELNLPLENVYLAKDRSGQDPINFTKSTSALKYGLKHGDLLFLVGVDTRSQVEPKSLESNVLESDLDQMLEKMDGKIPRKRNEQYCSHPLSGRCIHCSPLEPGDPSYLEQCDPPVKFMPFHAHIKKLQSSSGLGRMINLENLSCMVKPGCKDHPPWPEGICTKCQPKPITLNRQSYRHCDYVQFEHPQMIDDFLDYWRETGCQRIGILLGKYSLLDKPGSSPLAIKCSISAIYEPTQDSNARSVSLPNLRSGLLPANVSHVMQQLGWEPVGWIFTDLLADDSRSGSVKHYRGTIETYFLSAMECVTAAHLQNIHPNACKHTREGVFGSKFVTVVATGDKDNQINFEAYQVSNQAMALCQANILVPTFDAPELGWVKETTREQFVPEVFYSCQDEYGNQVTKMGRPLPIEYLLIDMAVGFPRDAIYSLPPPPLGLAKPQRFPIENRLTMQNFDTFARFYKALQSVLKQDEPVLHALANFHVLSWLCHSEMLDEPALDTLIAAVKEYTLITTDQRLREWALNTGSWANIKEMMACLGEGRHEEAMLTEEPAHPPMNGHSSSAAATWACQHCTFENRSSGGPHQECEMCGLPRS